MGFPSDTLEEIAQTNARFSREFYKALKNHDGNLVASPLSAQLVLALAQLGAGGDTASEMASALCLPTNQDAGKNGFKALLSILKSTDKLILEIANRMYVKEGFPLNQKFVDASKEVFNASAESVNFLDPQTPGLINTWVAKATRDKIKNLIPAGLFDGLTRLVLVNAVYFKGPWQSPFDPSRTSSRDFYVNQETAVQTSFMYQKTTYGYAKLDELNAQLVEMPYEGGDLSLVILLPDSRTGLAELESKMETQDLGTIMKKVHRRELELYLPKFKLEVSINLNEPLKKMGFERMYSSHADFSGITGAESLQVSDVLQKAFIEISEEGTEAAAATGLCIDSASRNPIFNVNHPFLLKLIHRQPQILLFGGRFVKPPAM